VDVVISVGRAKYVKSPKYTICPAAHGDSCSLGSLPVGQADELQADVKVGHRAALGEQVELIADVAGRKDRSFHASATTLVLAPVTPSTSISPSTIPPVTLPAIPGTSPTNPSGLFPTVSPSASTPDPVAHGSTARHARLATAANATPLDSRFIGGQLAGLAVLAGAITIAIARLSLRPTKPLPAQQGTGQQGAGQEGTTAKPDPADKKSKDES
jgi:hypothetical protein